MNRKLCLPIFLAFFNFECGDQCVNIDEQLECNGLENIKFGDSVTSTLDEECFHSYGRGNFTIYEKYGISIFTLGDADNSNYIVYSFHLTTGWIGQTDRGLKLGDPIEKFNTLYPKSESYPGSVPSLINPDVYLEAEQATCDTHTHLQVYPDEQGNIFYMILW
ncbi:MAG: hypothetical protein PHN19_02560 [Patescibacteria group bacterium]|nr:hypothetical protein [Patescibacteria group bacterium]